MKDALQQAHDMFTRHTEGGPKNVIHVVVTPVDSNPIVGVFSNLQRAEEWAHKVRGPGGKARFTPMVIDAP
jgi:hypothetical protein